MRKLNLNPLIRMISRYKICDYSMINSPYLVFYLVLVIRKHFFGTTF